MHVTALVLQLVIILTTNVFSVSTQTVLPEKPLFCFQCRSDEEPACESLNGTMDESPFFRPCHGEKAIMSVCKKTIQIHYVHSKPYGHKQRVIVRECSWEENIFEQCYADYNHEGYKEIHCHCFSPGCNAGSLMTSLGLVALTILTLPVLKFTKALEM